MKYLIFFFLLFYCGISLFCQEANILEQDLVVLKNGKNISCDIIENEGKTVLIKFSDELVLLKRRTIDYIIDKGTEISFFGKVSNGFEENAIYSIEDLNVDTIFNDQGLYHLEPVHVSEIRGAYNVTYFGGITSVASDVGNIGLENVAGYQFNNWTGLGLGLGLYSTADSRFGIAIPTFLEYRGYVGQNLLSAYYSLGIGVTFGLKDSGYGISSTRPGRFYHPALGVKLGNNNFALMIDLGYRISNVNYILESNSNLSDEMNIISRGLMLRVGILY